MGRGRPKAEEKLQIIPSIKPARGYAAPPTLSYGFYLGDIAVL